MRMYVLAIGHSLMECGRLRVSMEGLIALALRRRQRLFPVSMAVKYVKQGIGQMVESKTAHPVKVAFLLIALITVWIATPFINDRSGYWEMAYWICVAFIPTVGLVFAFRWQSLILGVASILTFLAWPILLCVAMLLGGI